MTREERNAWQREYRRRNAGIHTKTYEKSKKGKLMRTYRNMESRVKGIHKTKAHLYSGLEILNREDFYEWSFGDQDFNRLYEGWVSSDYDMKLSPSIDRLDTSKGYLKDNIRWITHSENSRLGAISGDKNG